MHGRAKEQHKAIEPANGRQRQRPRLRSDIAAQHQGEEGKGNSQNGQAQPRIVAALKGVGGRSHGPCPWPAQAAWGAGGGFVLGVRRWLSGKLARLRPQGLFLQGASMTFHVFKNLCWRLPSLSPVCPQPLAWWGPKPLRQGHGSGRSHGQTPCGGAGHRGHCRAS